MNEPKTYSISEAHALGVAKVARAAEDEGMVMLERNGQKVVMMVSMTPVGIARFFEMLIRAGQENVKMAGDSEFQEYLAYLRFMVEKKLGLKFDDLSLPELPVASPEVVQPKKPRKARAVKK